MNLAVVGCSHHNTPIEVRERLGFSADQTRRALAELRHAFVDVEAVVLSTCNRVEFYLGSDSRPCPTGEEVAELLARFHGLRPDEVLPHLYIRRDQEAIEHLFLVTSSLNSMVLGEPQILSQVKQAYQLATEEDSAGVVLHAMFQAALKVARRVAGETTIHQRRVSIPSVAVADFAQQIFERFDDKKTLVIGGGEMAEETLRYLQDQSGHDVTVINRSPERADLLAGRWQGRARPWSELAAALAEADLVISTTGAEQPIVSLRDFAAIEAVREPRPLFVLDLAVPRDFDPAIGGRPDVYLYSIDDLRQACEANRAARDKELPAAMRIVRHETERFLADLHRRASGPIIRQLRAGWEKPKEEELRRLLNKLPQLDDRSREEIRQAFDRLVNKLLHPPMESLRDESREGTPGALLDALSRLFRLKD